MSLNLHELRNVLYIYIYYGNKSVSVGISVVNS